MTELEPTDSSDNDEPIFIQDIYEYGYHKGLNC